MPRPSLLLAFLPPLAHNSHSTAVQSPESRGWDFLDFSRERAGLRDSFLRAITHAVHAGVRTITYAQLGHSQQRVSSPSIPHPAGTRVQHPGWLQENLFEKSEEQPRVHRSSTTRKRSVSTVPPCGTPGPISSAAAETTKSFRH